MSFNDRTRTGTDYRQIQQGWDVYGSDGEKIGDVSEIHESYFVVSKGFFFPKERYIPFSAIRGLEHDRVEVNLTKADLDSDRWDSPPAMTEHHESESRQGFATGRTTEREGTGERSIPVREERLEAHKQMRETGEVEVRKEVVTERQSMEVPVTREEVVVERRPVNRTEAEGMNVGRIGEGETIRVPVREEQVTVEKTPVVTEEISIGKRQVQDTERISDTVRREEVGVEHSGQAHVSHRPGGVPHWNDIRNEFQSGWQNRHGTSGRTWEQDEPAYRYGWESGSDPRYQGRDWSTAESDLRGDWGSRYGKHGKWDDVKANVREAYDRSRR
jgi:uncharacterized protein (TIGR02271 family)